MRICLERFKPDPKDKKFLPTSNGHHIRVDVGDKIDFSKQGQRIPDIQLFELKISQHLPFTSFSQAFSDQNQITFPGSGVSGPANNWCQESIIGAKSHTVLGTPS